MKGEFEFIDGIRKRFPVPEGITGIGDDCAIIPEKEGFETLVSTDMLVEGTHFLLDDITPYQLGWKSAASNFSDIAAMGAAPVGAFLAVALPRGLSDDWSDEFLRGYGDISKKYGFLLLGGDTTASPDRLCISITVMGRAEKGRAIRRDGARPGDFVCVTGRLGDSAAGLEAILRNLPREEEVPYLIERHYLPTPRINEGIELAATEGIHSMMDISDGVASDIRHIMEESGVGAEIDLDKLPLSNELRIFCGKYGLDINKLAVGGGEDYELLFTMDPKASPKIDYTVIGRITEARTLVWKGSDKDYCGFRHF